MVSGPPLAGFEGPGPPNKQKTKRTWVQCPLPAFLRALGPLWKKTMAFLRSFYVADDIWRFA